MIPDDAPPLAVYTSRNPLGLKTRSFKTGLARIERLLARSTEVELSSVELTVSEPCSRALVEALLGPFDHDVAMSGGRVSADVAAVIAAMGHTHDAVAGEAWRRFGTPTKVCGIQERPAWHIEWGWEVSDDAELASRRFEEWSPFAAAHDQLMRNEVAPVVEIRAVWSCRLRVAGDRVVEAPYPPSSLHVFLGRTSSMFPELVLPHTSMTDAFLADYQAVNCALGIMIPMHGYKLCTPKKRGNGRVYRRLY